MIFPKEALLDTKDYMDQVNRQLRAIQSLLRGHALEMDIINVLCANRELANRINFFVDLSERHPDD